MTRWIAVVDDDLTNLKAAGQILSRNDYRVSALKSGSALLEFVKQNTPDLILLDIVMPGLDGFETLGRLRAYESGNGLAEIPVIFLTADDKIDTESRGFEMGVADFIRKPFYPEVLLGRIDNILSRQERMNRIAEEASIDSLTGLLNKGVSAERIGALCKSQKGCLLMIDLDSFKPVNDIYGHDMGDAVLKAFSSTLAKCAPPESVFGRIGGDEFAAFFKDVRREEYIESFTRRLEESFTEEAERLLGEDMRIPLGASVGAVFVPEYGTDYGELIKLADKALYHVKQNGKHGHFIYRSTPSGSSANRADELRSIEMILGERDIPDCAMWLEKDIFVHVYRFLRRYMINYGVSACEILVDLSESGERVNESFEEKCAEFGEFLKQSLRKSDIMVRLGKDQYLFLLMEIKEDMVEGVIDRVLGRWNERSGGTLRADYRIQMLRPDSERGEDSDRRRGRRYL